MRTRPTATMPYSDPRATPCTSSGIEYGKAMRTSTRKATHPSATRPACAPRPGFSQKARARCTMSRCHGPSGGSAPRDAGGGGGGGGVSTVALIGLRSWRAAARKIGPVGRARELPQVEAGPELHVRTGLGVVRRRLVLVEVDEAGVLHPVPVAGRDRKQRLARVAAADGRQRDRSGLHVGGREVG